MRKCKLLLIPVCLILLLSCVPSFGITAEEPKFTYGTLKYDKVDEINTINFSSAEEMIGSMDLVASNEQLELYIEPTNLAIAVKDLRTGHITLSNPYDLESQGVAQIDAVYSQVKLQYTKLATGDSETMYSKPECVDLKQFVITPIDNGVEVIYSMGKDVNNDYVPDVMTEKSYKWLIDQLNKPEKLEEINETSIDDVIYFLTDEYTGAYSHLVYNEMSEDERAEQLDQYANLKKTNLYIKTGGLRPDLQEKLESYLVAAGYDNAKKRADIKDSGMKLEEDEEVLPVNFKFTVRYTLSGANFYAELDAKKIEYDTENFALEAISLLPYFGATPAQKDGYIFLPDGSGSIIAFDDPTIKYNNTAATMQGNLYGVDNGTTYPRDAVFDLTLHLPVFGMKDGDNAFFAILEEGDAMSSLVAERKLNNYFAVYPTFTIHPKDNVRMEGKAGTGSSGISYIAQFSEEPFKGNFKVRYDFLNGDDANYVGMAKTYRSYLESKGWNAKEVPNTIRFQLTSLGSVQYADKWGFIPFTNTAALTTYKDSQTMINELKKMGVSDVGLQLLGWQDDGLDTLPVNDFDSSSDMGGTDELKALVEFCKKNKIGFYPEADVMYVANEGWFDGFSARTDAVRLINNQYGTHAFLSPTYGYYIPDSYAVTPVRYKEYLNDFLEEYTEETGGKSINLANMGLYLNSDYHSDRFTTRQAAKNLIVNLLKEKAGNTQMAFYGGNAYVLPYATQLLDAPINSTGREGQTYDVPFLQMVIMNKISYAAPAINTTTDRQDYLLRCVESQSSPSFNLIYRNADILKSTTHNQYYNVDFNINKKQFAADYSYVKDALDGVAGEEIVEHTRLSADKDLADNSIVRIRYENDVILYINYSENDVVIEYNGEKVEIAAQSYTKLNA